jgi:putative flippase GtrA
MKTGEFIKYLKYSIGGGLNLVLKIILVGILDIFTIPAYFNYFITQITILFISYIYHSKITFTEKLNFSSFILFTKCVIGLKFVDYLLFNVNVYIFHTDNIYAVIVSTLLVFILRYLLMDKYIFNHKDDNEKDLHNRCNNIR